MSSQVIKQPDGRLAIWSTGVDDWTLRDATPDEVVGYFVERAAADARLSALRTVATVLEDRPRDAYFQFAMTFAEAEERRLAARAAEKDQRP